MLTLLELGARARSGRMGIAIVEEMIIDVEGMGEVANLENTFKFAFDAEQWPSIYISVGATKEGSPMLRPSQARHVQAVLCENKCVMDRKSDAKTIIEIVIMISSYHSSESSLQLPILHAIDKLIILTVVTKFGHTPHRTGHSRPYPLWIWQSMYIQFSEDLPSCRRSTVIARVPQSESGRCPLVISNEGS
jgi:hypothetical protein